MRQPFRLVLFALAFLVLSPLTFFSPPRKREPFAASATILWAWERPEDVRFLQGRPIGVAYLARTFYLSGTESVERRRMQPLLVAPDTWLMAVARIEARPGKIQLSPQQLDELAARIAAMARVDGVRAVQLDFDATASQRDFYRELLTRVRQRLPLGVPLSITALVSWCTADGWLADLPVDEAVPMLFRMGIGARNAEAYLRAHGGFEDTPCAGSRGLSTDERLEAAPSAERTYLFSPVSWTEDELRAQTEVSR